MTRRHPILTRRSLLRSSAIAGAGCGVATMFLPARGRAQARPGCGTSPFVVTVEAQAGWDPTFLVDPKVHPSFTPWRNVDLRTVAGTNVVYAPSRARAEGATPDASLEPYRVAGGEDFFVRHGTRLLVVNGVDTRTVSHEVGPRVTFSGTQREGFPSLAGLVAAARGPTLPLSLMASGGFVSAAGLVPITRAGSTSVLKLLSLTNQPEARVGDPGRYHPDSVFSLLRARVAARDARLSAAHTVPREAAALAAIERTRAAETTRLYDELAASFDAAAGTPGDAALANVAAVLTAMDAGACVAAHIVTTEAFDTHANHDQEHPTAMQNLLDIVDAIITGVDARPRLAEAGVIVVVGSDFGRTTYNGEEGAVGKDHFPVTSMVLAGLGSAAALIEGGRAIGETSVLRADGTVGNGVVARRVKASGGDIVVTTDDDPDGFVLEPGHIHVALRAALGFCGGDLADRFPLSTVSPAAVLPLLRRG